MVWFSKDVADVTSGRRLAEAEAEPMTTGLTGMYAIAQIGVGEV
jgi:hypothetical protein